MIKVASNQEGSFIWHHLHEGHGRLGVVSKDIDNPLISSLKNGIRLLNQKVFTITTTPKGENAGEIDSLSILDMERYPSPENDPTGYADVRMLWVQQYFNLISYIYDKKRIEFVPLAKYRPHEEGPLLGYFRAIDEMEESENKKILMGHLAKLEEVKWILSNNGDLTYNVTGTTEKEKLESLFIGAWSYWSFTAFIEEPIPINLFVEFDECLLTFPVDEDKRKHLSFIINHLSNLTFSLAMSLTVKSNLMFPLPEAKVEHVMFESVQVDDLDTDGNDCFSSELAKEEYIWEHQGNYRKMNILLANE